jgi:hypothetical protein
MKKNIKALLYTFLFVIVLSFILYLTYHYPQQIIPLLMVIALLYSVYCVYNIIYKLLD